LERTDVVTKSSKSVFRGLQALRGIAAFLVVITHSGFYVSERLRPGFKYWTRGTSGVDLFFVLSGFVMIYSSVKLFSDPNGWRVFAERRIVRIVPVYWLATTVKLVALLAGSSYILHSQLSVLKEIASYLFLPTRNLDGEIRPLLGVGWTLNFEMFFYALFTFALRLRANVYWFVAAGHSIWILWCSTSFSGCSSPGSCSVNGDSTR
jgi:exopolysaccharide production protein ExoZ